MHAAALEDAAALERIAARGGNWMEAWMEHILGVNYPGREEEGGEEGSAIVITTDAATLDFLHFDAAALLPQEPPPVLPPGLPPGPPQELPQVES